MKLITASNNQIKGIKKTNGFIKIQNVELMTTEIKNCVLQSMSPPFEGDLLVFTENLLLFLSKIINN